MKGLLRNELVKAFFSHSVTRAVIVLCVVVFAWAVFNVIFLSRRSEKPDNSLLPKQELITLKTNAERKLKFFSETDTEAPANEREAALFSFSDALADYYLCNALVENRVGYDHWKADILSYYYKGVAEIITNAIAFESLSSELFSLDEEPESFLSEAGMPADDLTDLKKIAASDDWRQYYYFKLSLLKQISSVSAPSSDDAVIHSLESEYFRLAAENEIEPSEDNAMYLLWKKCLLAEKNIITKGINPDSLYGDEVKVLRSRLKTSNPLPRQGSASYFIETAMKFSSVLFLAGMVVSCYLIRLEFSQKTINRLLLQPLRPSVIRTSKFLAGSIAQGVLTVCFIIFCILCLGIFFPSGFL